VTRTAKGPWRTALITGASSGIGEALAKDLSARGVEVVLAARRSDALEALASELRGRGGRVHTEVLDVSRPEATVEAIRRVDAALGGLDLVLGLRPVALVQVVHHGGDALDGLADLPPPPRACSWL
jgi:NADP-dependent 3-hydroxy acid dehydrogenase YdfG